MLKVVSVEHMRRVEAAADAAGVSYATMMENAGTATAHQIADYLESGPDHTGERRILFLIGTGNNGGDGLVAGRVLAGMSDRYQVEFYLLAHRSAEDLNFQAALVAGIPITYVDDDRDFQTLTALVTRAEVIADAVFGIGVRLPLRGKSAEVLGHVRLVLQERKHIPAERISPNSPRSGMSLPKPYIIAVDCPSGLDCDTGQVDEKTIVADCTITFIAAKPGLLTFPGAAYIGQLVVATIDIPDSLPELHQAGTVLVDSALAQSLLPARPPDSNKGTFGKTLIVAGSTNYVGAAGLCSMAAYRSGAGLVTVGAVGSVVSALAGHLLAPTWLLLPHDMGVIAASAVSVLTGELAGYSALLLGPGWGQEGTTRDFLLKLLTVPEGIRDSHRQNTMGFATKRANAVPNEQSVDAVASLPPLVIDADGLNLLAQINHWWELLPPHTIITPHPGEMARLAGTTTATVQADRAKIALEKAAEWQVVLILKGAHTLIAAPDRRLFVLPFKTDALATAGTGDVLAGTITGFLAQGMSPVNAAVLGGYVQGMAGELAARQIGNSRSVIADDVLNNLGEVLTAIENH